MTVRPAMIIISSFIRLEPLGLCCQTMATITTIGNITTIHHGGPTTITLSKIMTGTVHHYPQPQRALLPGQVLKPAQVVRCQTGPRIYPKVLEDQRKRRQRVLHPASVQAHGAISIKTNGRRRKPLLRKRKRKNNCSANILVDPVTLE